MEKREMHHPYIIGKRLYLRPLEPSLDAHRLAFLHNSPDVRRYFNVYPTNDARSKDHLENIYRDFKQVLFGVSLIDDNVLIGVVGLKDINTLNQTAEFYIKINPELQGKGYGTEATKLMLRYGFLELNLNRIQTLDVEENIPGWKVDEKLGFKFEGIMREALMRHNRYYSFRIYSMLRREFMEILAANGGEENYA